MTLAPFDRATMFLTPCSKCRGNSFPMLQLAIGGKPRYRWEVTFVRDHLEVRCPECGYSFDMATADAKQSVTPLQDEAGVA